MHEPKVIFLQTTFQTTCSAPHRKFTISVISMGSRFDVSVPFGAQRFQVASWYSWSRAEIPRW